MAASSCGTIGYVAPFAIPEVIRHANAFALGAQATHPGVKVKLIWTNSWFSPDKEKKADLISGKFYEFKGPLYDQSGKLKVPAGKSLTVNDLYAMNWLVKGVVGSPKG